MGACVGLGPDRIVLRCNKSVEITHRPQRVDQRNEVVSKRQKAFARRLDLLALGWGGRAVPACEVEAVFDKLYLVAREKIGGHAACVGQVDPCKPWCRIDQDLPPELKAGDFMLKEKCPRLSQRGEFSELSRKQRFELLDRHCREGLMDRRHLKVRVPGAVPV